MRSTAETSDEKCAEVRLATKPAAHSDSEQRQARQH
jgi:hypothetical protein